MISEKNLTYKLQKVNTLDNSDIDHMYQLMSANYNHMTETMFVEDLSNKSHVGVITDENENIQGFTTYVINPGKCAGTNYHIIFSGDTIIHPEHWGSQIMMKGWCMTIGAMVATDNTKPWYWYLMSKGHRTYMYMPLFFSDYYPSILPSNDYPTLKTIADEVSNCLYGDDYNSNTGVIEFSESHGELNPALIEATYKKKNSPHVQLFLEKNPGFYKGDELVCIALLSSDNLIRTAKEYFLKGYQYQLDFL